MVVSRTHCLMLPPFESLWVYRLAFPVCPPQKCPFLWAPHCSLGQPESTPQSSFQSVQLFVLGSQMWVEIAAATLSGTSLRQAVHTHCTSIHQAAKLIAAFLRVARVTAGLAESNGSLLPGLWRTPPAGWLRRTGINSTLCSVIEYGLPLPFFMDATNRDGLTTLLHL